MPNKIAFYTEVVIPYRDSLPVRISVVGHTKDSVTYTETYGNNPSSTGTKELETMARWQEILIKLAREDGIEPTLLGWVTFEYIGWRRCPNET